MENKKYKKEREKDCDESNKDCQTKSIYAKFRAVS